MANQIVTAQMTKRTAPAETEMKRVTIEVSGDQIQITKQHGSAAPETTSYTSPDEALAYVAECLGVASSPAPTEAAAPAPEANVNSLEQPKY